MTDRRGGDARAIRLDEFVRSLKAVFGDRAHEVARRQVEMADADHEAIWREILARLEA